MGQIQNAISAAVGSVAVGAIAEQKTKGLKKEIGGLKEEVGTLTGDKTKLQGQVGELTSKKVELEGYVKDTYEEAKIAIGEAYKELEDVQARHSETKAELAKMNAEKERQAKQRQKEDYRQWVSTISKKRGRR